MVSGLQGETTPPRHPWPAGASPSLSESPSPLACGTPTFSSGIWDWYSNLLLRVLRLGSQSSPQGSGSQLSPEGLGIGIPLRDLGLPSHPSPQGPGVGVPALFLRDPTLPSHPSFSGILDCHPTPLPPGSGIVIPTLFHWVLGLPSHRTGFGIGVSQPSPEGPGVAVPPLMDLGSPSHSSSSASSQDFLALSLSHPSSVTLR